MLRKLNLKRTTGLAAALAAAVLTAPAPVNAQPPCTPQQVQGIIDYCTAYWQAPWQVHFASHSACVDYYMPGCWYVYTYEYGAVAPEAPATRPDD